MSRHKRRMHRKIGKYQDRPRDRKAGINSGKARHARPGKSSQKSRNRKTFLLR